MANTLFLECNTGISGDMMVAALLDLGVDEQVLKKSLDSLHLSGYQIKVSRVKKSGLDVCDFDVQLDEVHENHDHDMKYLYGHLEKPDEVHGEHVHNHVREVHEHYHEEESHHKEHHHEAHHHEGHEHHHHEHRGLKEITSIIENSSITARAKQIALRIFQVIAEAEAKAHGETIEKVHFHEVGAVDSIVDIVAVAVCLDQLDIGDVIVPYLCEGTGSVRCQHGILPVPVPAVANIVQANHIALKFTNTVGELVTPTGAAIVAAIRTSEMVPETLKIQKIGLGAGKRTYERPSIVRAMLIESDSMQRDVIYRVETDIDDSTGEQLGYVMERLMEAGARDVHFQPIYMKKNRPAYELVVICDEQDIATMESIIFQETTTIGIRRMKMERTMLERKMDVVSTKYGKLEVKICTLPDGTQRVYPEYESVAALAQEQGVSLQEIIKQISGV